MRKAIQVLIVLFILVLAIGLALPAVSTLWQASNRMACMSNLKRIADALHGYQDTHGVFPQARLNRDDIPPHQRLSYLAIILPYLNHDPVYKTIDLTKAWDVTENQSAAGVAIQEFLCPSFDLGKQPPGRTHYVGIAGVGANAAELPEGDAKAGFFGYSRQLPRKGEDGVGGDRFHGIADGASNTILLTETTSLLGSWIAAGSPTVRGVDPTTTPYVGWGRPFGGLHRDTVSAVFVDGSARNILYNISPRVLEALTTIAGGEGKDHDLD